MYKEEHTSISKSHDSMPRVTLIHENLIYNEIKNKRILILDLRPREEYENCHLDFSINIPNDENPEAFYEYFDIKKLAEEIKDHGTRDRLLHFKQNYIYIVMSEEHIPDNIIFNHGMPHNDEIPLIKKSLLLYEFLFKQKAKEIGLFNLGFKHVAEHYDFLIRVNKNSPCAIVFPSEIFENKLYIGNRKHATNKDLLEKFKITHVVNVTKEVENAFESKGVEYLNIRIEDTADTDISKHFREVYEFMEKALSANCQNEDANKQLEDLHKLGIDDPKYIMEVLKRNSNCTKKNNLIQQIFKIFYPTTNCPNRVLVHCCQGVSRSTSMVIMYIIKKFYLDVYEAKEFVKFHRCCTEPNDSFYIQLENFQNNCCEFPLELSDGENGSDKDTEISE